jgi:hypothetical protein
MALGLPLSDHHPDNVPRSKAGKKFGLGRNLVAGPTEVGC